MSAVHACVEIGRNSGDTRLGTSGISVRRLQLSPSKQRSIRVLTSLSDAVSNLSSTLFMNGEDTFGASSSRK